MINNKNDEVFSFFYFVQTCNFFFLKIAIAVIFLQV